MSTASVPLKERVTITIDTAVQMCGLSRSKIYQCLGDGRLRSTKVDGRRLVSVESLRQLVEAE